ncbi:MAG: tetratricopeptide repeat protein [Planctomycetota bacterium]
MSHRRCVLRSRETAAITILTGVLALLGLGSPPALAHGPGHLPDRTQRTANGSNPLPPDAERDRAGDAEQPPADARRARNNDDEAGVWDRLREAGLKMLEARDADKPPAVERSPLVTRLLRDTLLTDDDRRTLRIFHGDWDGLTPDSPDEAALLALHRFQFNDPVFDNPDIDPLTRAEALLRRGDAEASLAILRQPIPDTQTHQARYLRAQAAMDLGDPLRAAAEITGTREAMQHDARPSDPAELTAAARAIVLLARLEGRAGLEDFRLAMSLLEQARKDLDPLYWPAIVAEAEILLSKGNKPEAAQAAQQAMSLNPRSGDAALVMGRLLVDRFDFAGAEGVVSLMRSVDKDHPVADHIEVMSLLRQKDAPAARETIDAALSRYPSKRSLLILKTLVEALAYDDAALAPAIADYRQLVPKGGTLDAALGLLYSDARQYASAIKHLGAAIEAEPGWAEPRVELGRVLMQDGDLPAAKLALRRAADLDPSHHDVHNYLKLVSRMVDWPTLETEHFIIRYRDTDADGNPVPDKVWARDVARYADTMAQELIDLYGFKPTRKTQFDLMPDDLSFMVRIAGMPGVLTVGACTGDVIAMTLPKPGIHRQFETYDWLLVLRHEYVHTVTLGKTANRIPHWFTEALAVQQETTGRQWSAYQLLANATNTDTLFTLDNISWGFIRPETPSARSLAYAQSHWLADYIQQRFGFDALITMMELQAQGQTNRESFVGATGYDADTFMDEFLAFADEQVESWGMKRSKQEAVMLKGLKTRDGSWSDAADLDKVNELLADEFPGQPDLLKRRAELLLDTEPLDTDAAAAAVREYGRARPVDPWTARMLVKLAAKRGDLQQVIAELADLDQASSYDSEYASELAQLHRTGKRFDEGLAAIERALLLEPFNGTFRSRAVRLALQNRDLATAAFHLESLTILEPDDADHWTRLAYVQHRLGNTDAATDAALKARELNPKAPVEKLLPSPSPAE